MTMTMHTVSLLTPAYDCSKSLPTAETSENGQA